MKSNIEKEWTTKEGYKAVVLLNTKTAFRCGYIGIPHNHKAYGLDYYHYFDDMNESDILYEIKKKINEIEVHGGLTYSDKDDKYPIKSSNLWWFGFDAGHSGDKPDCKALFELCETQEEKENAYRYKGLRGEIRTLEYMINECNSLSKQLFDIDNNCDIK